MQEGGCDKMPPAKLHTRTDVHRFEEPRGLGWGEAAGDGAWSPEPVLCNNIFVKQIVPVGLSQVLLRPLSPWTVVTGG